MEVENPRPDCPLCFGTGIKPAFRGMTGPVSQEIVACWACLEAEAKKVIKARRKHAVESGCAD